MGLIRKNAKPSRKKTDNDAAGSPKADRQRSETPDLSHPLLQVGHSAGQNVGRADDAWRLDNDSLRNGTLPCGRDVSGGRVCDGSRRLTAAEAPVIDISLVLARAFARPYPSFRWLPKMHLSAMGTFDRKCHVGESFKVDCLCI